METLDDNIKVEYNLNNNFIVYTYEVDCDSRYKHWSEDLSMVIEKNGVKIELNYDEIKQLIATLPRTFGGGY